MAAIFALGLAVVSNGQDTVTAPYDPFTLPNWLKFEPGATILPNPPGKQEATTTSRWQTASCSQVNRIGRRIVSTNQIVEFYIPTFAALKDTSDIDYVEYYVRYGPKREKVWLQFMFGPLVDRHAPRDIHETAIRWTWRIWDCNGIEGRDVRGVSSGGIRWRYIDVPAGRFAAYDGVPTKAADYFDRILDTMCCGKCPLCK